MLLSNEDLSTQAANGGQTWDSYNLYSEVLWVLFVSFLVWDGSDEQHQTAQVLHLINLQMIWDDTELLKMTRMTPEKYKSYGFGDLQLHTWGT